MDWDALETFEAVARLRSFTKAATALGLSQSTVSRHISRLEARAGSPLLLRTVPIELTRRGQALQRAVIPMTSAALNAQSALEALPELRGEVRVAAVREAVRWVLLPRLPEFVASHPELRLTLLAGNEVRSLATGEADISLRWFRPERGDLIIKRLQTETYALFAHPDLKRAHDTPWLGLAGSLSQIPEQQSAARIFASRPAHLAFEDLDSLGVATMMGLGVALLPRSYVLRLGGLVEVNAREVGGEPLDVPERPMWLVVHRSRQNIPIVRAVLDWIEDIFHPPEDLYSRGSPKGYL